MMKNSEFQPAEEKREPKSLFCEPQKDRPSGKYAEKDLKREQKDCRQIHQVMMHCTVLHLRLKRRQDGNINSNSKMQ